ncbi:MAG: hypothetical protein ACMVO3_13725 [Thalassobaculum sp.]
MKILERFEPDRLSFLFNSFVLSMFDFGGADRSDNLRIFLSDKSKKRQVECNFWWEGSGNPSFLYVQCAWPGEFDIWKSDIIFAEIGKRAASNAIAVRDLNGWVSGRDGSSLFDRFCELLESDMKEKKKKRVSLLDVGGSKRSGVDPVKFPKFADRDVLDIEDRGDVDYVGDAHQLSVLVPKNKYDAFISVSSFEHFESPWVVVDELRKSFSLGSIGLVHSHQTIGMHDMPWDFFRFSDSAWRSLFRPEAGFEVVETSMSQPSFIVPLYGFRETTNTSVGFISSSAIVRRVEPVTSDGFRRVVLSSYPG